MKLFVRISSIDRYFNQIAVRQIRPCSQESKAKSSTSGTLYKGDDLKDNESYISTSQTKSMIRFHKIKQLDDETKYEKEYRIKYEQVQLWNHNYWLKNNEQFHEGKKQFKTDLKKSDSIDDQHQQEQLLPYYKNFLDSNHHRNIAYNMEWYKKNIGLLMPAIRAILSRLIKNLKLKIS